MSGSIGPMLRHYWQRTSSLPGGKWLFSRLLGMMVPYTGTLGATVQQLEPGYCRVLLRDHRKVRNHLGSIHALALGNLGEMTTGLALMNSLPAGSRGILTGLTVNYLKKARGELTAECHCGIPDPAAASTEQEIVGEIRDAGDETVCVLKACWLIGPEKEPSHARTN